MKIRVAVPLLLGASIAFGQGVTPSRHGDPQEQRSPDWQLVYAQDFLRALLPELQGHHYVLTTSKQTLLDANWAPMAPLDLTVSTFRDSKECLWARESPDTYPQCVKIVLGASYVFHPDGTLSELHINPEKRLKAADSRVHIEVEQHPEWTEHQIAVALQKAGARFDPEHRDAFVQGLPLDRLEPFLGKLTVSSVKFEFRHIQKPTPLAELYWTVEATSTTPSGDPSNWVILFEPFSGEVTQVERTQDTPAFGIQKK